VLLDKVKDLTERQWYVCKGHYPKWLEGDVLMHQIESGSYRRQGRALTNFDRTLPPLSLTSLSKSQKIPTILIS
jgi:hypothetical protein